MKWHDVRKKLPRINEYVLVIAPSGYMGTPYRFNEAKYDPNYKGWTDCSNTRITDGGEDVTHWTTLPQVPNNDS